MTLKAMYNSFASQYATADCFGSITDSHTCAISQITRAHIGLRPHYKILDFGVGDGAFLKKLEQTFSAEMDKNSISFHKDEL